MGWDGPVAAVFGSARAREGDAEYMRARAVGRHLARAGWAVMTGGYSGVMEAASRGATDVQGHAVGVTFPSWTTTPNAWLTEERPTASLFDRLRELVSADALVAVGGGVGTLAEVALAWNLRQKGDASGPLVLVGPRWAEVVNALATHLEIGDIDISRLTFVDEAEDVIEHLPSPGRR